MAHSGKHTDKQLSMYCCKRSTQSRRTQALSKRGIVRGAPDDVERNAHGPPGAWHARRCIGKDKVPWVSGAPTRKRGAGCVARRCRMAVYVAAQRRAVPYPARVRRVTCAGVEPLAVPGERGDLLKPKMPRGHRGGRYGSVDSMRDGGDAMCPACRPHRHTSRRPSVARRCRVRCCMRSCALVHTVRSLRVRVRYTMPSLRPRPRPASWGKGRRRAWRGARCGRDTPSAEPHAELSTALGAGRAAPVERSVSTHHAQRGRATRVDWD